MELRGERMNEVNEASPASETSDLERLVMLPCPFCGHDPELMQIGNNYTKKRSVVVKCKKCRIQRKDSALVQSMEWLIDVAIQQWNQRAT